MHLLACKEDSAQVASAQASTNDSTSTKRNKFSYPVITGKASGGEEKTNKRSRRTDVSCPRMIDEERNYPTLRYSRFLDKRTAENHNTTKDNRSGANPDMLRGQGVGNDGKKR